MMPSSTRQTNLRKPNFRVLVYLPERQGGSLFLKMDSYKGTAEQAISSVRSKMYRKGVSAHYYRYVAVDCKNQ